MTLMSPLFRAPYHEAQFERDGYVLVEGFGADAVEEAAAVFSETTGPVRSGFHNSLRLDVTDERTRIAAFVTRRFREPIERILHGVRPLTGAFLSKGSDGDSMVSPHQDWSLVDERIYRSFNIWMPLCETTAQNGALGIVRRSHRLPYTIRGTNVPSGTELRADLLLPYVTAVPMRAGDALIYEHRMIHASSSNRSGVARTAMSVSVISHEAPALHYVGDLSAPGTVRELEVDDGFFDRYRVGEPLDIGHYRSREVAYAPPRIGVREVAALQSSGVGRLLRSARVRLRA